MPFCQLPLPSLDNISLFGYQIVAENEEVLIILCPQGRKQLVYKEKPILWFEDEDMGDALQLNAIGVFID